MISEILFGELNKYSDYIYDIDELKSQLKKLEVSDFSNFILFSEYINRIICILDFCSEFNEQPIVDVNINYDNYDEEDYEEVESGVDDHTDLDINFENVRGYDRGFDNNEDEDEYEEVNAEQDEEQDEDEDEEIEEVDIETIAGEDINNFDINENEYDEYTEIDTEVQQSQDNSDSEKINTGLATNENDFIDMSDDFPDFNLNRAIKKQKPVLNDNISDATMNTIIKLGEHAQKITNMFLKSNVVSMFKPNKDKKEKRGK